jgi:small subunit ribosomal protein S2
MKELLEAGVHFGHQSRRWNPKMAQYIFAERNGIYIIDLQKTLRLLQTAYEFVQDIAAGGGVVLFVGTKKQAQETVVEEATKCQMFYVNHRWLGGMLTNYETIKRSIDRLMKIEGDEASGIFEQLPKKEVMSLRREKTKLNNNLAGIKTMGQLPEAVIITDIRKEHIAVKEANKLGIPVVAIIDTNCDPDPIDYPIPANDDAIRAIKLICSILATAVIEGRASALEGADDQEAPQPESATDENEVSEEASPPDDDNSIVFDEDSTTPVEETPRRRRRTRRKQASDEQPEAKPQEDGQSETEI